MSLKDKSALRSTADLLKGSDAGKQRGQLSSAVIFSDGARFGPSAGGQVGKRTSFFAARYASHVEYINTYDFASTRSVEHAGYRPLAMSRPAVACRASQYSTLECAISEGSCMTTPQYIQISHQATRS